MTQERKQFQRTEDGHLTLMSNEERNLLITDLTARINYGVICLIERVDDFGPIYRNEKLTGFCFDDIGGFHFEVGGGLNIVFAEKIMPYLRPMSSITKEEEVEWFESVVPTMDCDKQLDFYCKYHFDYRELIKKGLALEAPEGMYIN